MNEWKRLAIACTILWMMGSTAFTYFTQPPDGQATVAAPATQKDLPAGQSTPAAPPDAKKDPAPTLKPEDEVGLRKLREKIMGDKIQIDQIAAQARDQIEQRQADISRLSKQLADETEKAVTASGADRSKWDLNQDLVFVPKKPDAPKPGDKKPDAPKPEPKKQ